MSSGPDLATDPQIYRIIKSRGLTQVEAGAILGIKQPHVSAPMRYRSDSFSRTTIGFFSSDRRSEISVVLHTQKRLTLAGVVIRSGAVNSTTIEGGKNHG
jgi:predicted XRE-type DNA-binding protein